VRFLGHGVEFGGARVVGVCDAQASAGGLVWLGEEVVVCCPCLCVWCGEEGCHGFELRYDVLHLFFVWLLRLDQVLEMRKA
jgi:hypothetical protein